MDTALPRSTPESVGIPSGAIEAFVQGVEERVGGLHSFMLLRHGQVAAEAWWAPYAPERPHMLFSLSKSFTSTAVGLAVAEGRLTVDDPVVSFFPEEAPRRVSRNLAAMRVRHLLSMNTGHGEDTFGPMHARRDGDWARAFLGRPVTHKPGSHFLYNTGATYMLSAIVQRLTGQTLVEYLTPRLFEPLGIETPTWETCPRGVNQGGTGLNVRTEDIARFGQLYLQEGAWQGQQVVPAAWVAEATSPHSDNAAGDPASDWQQGYGYQFWRCRHGAYRGDGAFGQFCLVMPAQDAVLAVTSGVRNMQGVLDQVWECLLPAMAPQALPPAPEAEARLAGVLGNRRVAPVAGEASSAAGRAASGRYRLEENPPSLRALTFRFRRGGATVRLSTATGVAELACTPDTWQEGHITSRRASWRARRMGMPPGPVAASGAWTDPETYAVRLCFYETPFVLDLACRFSEGGVTVHGGVNASFGPTEWAPIAGQRG
jgi:CubicO group peptidase (beta-lactamase class C family)